MKKFIKINEDVDLPNMIIGISTQQSDYKIAWEVNALLHTELIKQPDKTIFDNQLDKEICIPFYYYKSVDNIKYFMIKNTVPEYSVFSEIKHVNYLLIILPDDEAFIKTTRELLKKGKNFLGIFVLQLNKRQEQKIKIFLKKQQP